LFHFRYLINPTELDLKGKTAFFWAATAALTTVWAYFRLPEVKVCILFYVK
jgi:SP family general alpha glucoside:H+ symporter-like MFS transporter